MRVLLYSQYGGMGGSTRMLLNLGIHLADETEVFVAFPEVSDDIDRELRLAYPDLHFINQELDTLNALKADTALFHLPFSLPVAVDMEVRYKYVVSMEVIGNHPTIFTDELVSKFDHLFYLHEEQIQGLSDCVKKERCTLMPLINNINFSLPFKKTNTVAAIGAKTSLYKLSRIATLLPLGYRLVFWSRPDDFRLKRLLTYKYWRKTYIRWATKVIMLPPEVDVRTMMSQFDALIHLPDHGNGTSTVVSDALHCGKLVFLSNISANVIAYSGQSGVVILDKDIQHYLHFLEAYDVDVWQKIKQAHRNVYSRNDVMKKWRDAILEN